MQEFKGTKGKWEVKTDFREPTILNESGQVIFTHNKACYDTDEKNHKYYSHKKMIANSNLTANAPYLLDALQDLIKFCEENKVGAELDYAKDVVKNAIG